MRPSVLILLFVSCLTTNLQSQTSANYASSYPMVVNESPSITYIPTFTDSELRSRINGLSSAIAKPRFTAAVKSYINTYTIKRRDKTEAMLGRTTIYFPLFDKYLNEAQLPGELKYLSIVESALNPTARSRSGAMGLWQFMPPTGKDYGLRINSTVDERKDPNRATKAALKYLNRLYNKYNNWELALAAYNGGPGRVNRAIKRGRSKNFWRIQKHLPRETRNYVPAFIAATYIMNYYEAHNLVPRYPEQDLQMTRSAKIYSRLSFHEIVNITGVPMYILERLNPSYKRKYIPTSRSGNHLILPQQYMPTILHHLGRPDTEIRELTSVPIPAPVEDWETNYFKTTYTVQPNDQIQGIADIYGCTIQNIQLWNGFRHEYLSRGQELTIYIAKPVDTRQYIKIEGLPFLQLKEVPQPARFSNIKQGRRHQTTKKKTPKKKRSILKYDNAKNLKEDNYLFYLVRRNETLVEIVERFRGVDLDDVMVLNGFKNSDNLKPGTKIKVKKK